MNKIINYNLEIMSLLFVAISSISAINWTELSMLRQMTVVFMVLYTLHEWEESRFPGGFYRIFFSKCTIDPTVSEARMHFPVAVYLLVILLVPYILDNFVILTLVPLFLALFEGFIHTAGIVIHQLKKPYSPGMITAWMMFLYAIMMLQRLRAEMDIDAVEWALGIALTVVSFFIMELYFTRTVGITIREFQTAMRTHMLNRIRTRRGGDN